uniref:Uncharacterized protein n=1 Tax=Arundo donax TaxID=35708 RepID=A0A0A8ZJD9_ARUDO
MVHRLRLESAGSEQAADRRKAKRRQDAIMVIKKQMLRCNRGSEQGRFKRGYLGGDRGDAAIFYLACLVCTAPPSYSASR